MLAFKESLNWAQLASPSNLEVVSAEVDSNVVICLIYRPPNSSKQCNSSLISYFNTLDNAKDLLLIGD